MQHPAMIRRHPAISSDVSQAYLRFIFLLNTSSFSAFAIHLFLRSGTLYLFYFRCFFRSSLGCQFSPTMRRSLLVFFLVGILTIFLLVRSVWTLLSLLIEDAAADAIHRAELPRVNSSLTDQRPHIIPKIIHQTYKNETIPEVWAGAQQSCIDLHPDYEYIVRLYLNPPVLR